MTETLTTNTKSTVQVQEHVTAESRSYLPNPSIQVTPDQQLKQVEAPIETLKRGQVLVHIKATGICGLVPHGRHLRGAFTDKVSRSDIHFWKTGRIGSLVVTCDCILGHEASGVILECGEGVTNLQPGS